MINTVDKNEAYFEKLRKPHEIAEDMSELFSEDISPRVCRTLCEHGFLKPGKRGLFTLYDTFRAYITYIRDKQLRAVKSDLGEKYFNLIKELILWQDAKELCDDILSAATIKDARKILRESLLNEAQKKLKL